LLLGNFTITNICIVTTFNGVALGDMIVRVWLAESLEILIDVTCLVVRWMVAFVQGTLGRRLVRFIATGGRMMTTTVDASGRV
jgi:hypothetical protein